MDGIRGAPMSKPKSDVEQTLQEKGNATQSHTSNGTIPCAICGEPVQLESCKTDEDGSAVHAECYFDKLYDRAGSKDRNSHR